MIKLLSSLFVALVTSVTVSSVTAQELKGDVKSGAGKIAMCIGCHGIRVSDPEKLGAALFVTRAPAPRPGADRA